jgi:hypothetical protein
MQPRLSPPPAAESRSVRPWWLSTSWLPSLKAARVLWRDYAHVQSVKSQRAVDADGNPLPWYTYPAIEYLRQLDFSDKTVFEYGSGMSTVFWAGKAKHVVSVEDDEQWCDVVTLRFHTFGLAASSFSIIPTGCPSRRGSCASTASSKWT